VTALWSQTGVVRSSRHIQAFRENELDETVLPNLTAEDLKDLGVSIVGHRRKLLDAIAALRTDMGAKAPSAEAITAPSAPSVSPEDRAERRQDCYRNRRFEFCTSEYLTRRCHEGETERCLPAG
jgi:SAM domain (Sterile alpha motif)